ncbi:MAG: hypothetical protein RL514_1213 [Verrucomicrobiota bacterium]|jgi:hypothetical protein
MNPIRFLACLFVATALARTTFAAIPPAEKLLPADTLAVLTVSDWDQAAAAAKDFSLAQLWRDPAMKPFADKLTGKLRDVIGQEDKNFAGDWAEFQPLVGGQVTLAVIRGDWQGEPNTGPDVVVFLDVKDKTKALRAFLDRCEKRDADAGKTFQRETLRGVKFLRLAAKGGEKKPQPYVGQSGSLLLISESTKSLEQVLARLDGAGAGLDADPAFERARTTLGRDAQAFGWVNVKAFSGVLAKLPALGGADNPLAMAPGRILDAVGLASVEGLAFAARQTGEGTHVEAFLQAPQAKRKGLLALLAPEPKEAGPLPVVSGDVTKFTRVRLDGQKAFASVERILTDLNPQLAGVAALMLETVGKDKDPNFDLRKQVIGNLGADFVTVQKAPRGTALADLKSPPTLYLVGSPKPEALLQALRTVSPLPPTEREFLGRKIYTLTLLPGMGAAPGQKAQLSLSTTGGYLAASTDAGMLEEVLRGAEGQGKPLSAVPGLADAAQKIGGFNTGWFAYENQSETLRRLLETVKKDPQALETLFTLPMAAPGANVPALKQVTEFVDFSLLPPFAAISKYFGFTVQTSTGTPDGISFKTFIPMPAGLKK